MIVDDLLDFAENELKKRTAVDVRVGLGYTGVLLDNENLGLAYSFRGEPNTLDCSCEFTDRAGELSGNAWELAKLSLSMNVVDSSVGIAALNAAVNQDIEVEKGDILNMLNIRKGDKIGMVGNFWPTVRRLEEDAELYKNIELYIFERNERDTKEENVYPDWAAGRILPEVDIAIITATAIQTKTIDNLIKSAENAREVAVLGPTTPMVPQIFKTRGVTLLSGSIIRDTERALKILSQGGGTRTLHSVSEKINIVLG